MPRTGIRSRNGNWIQVFLQPEYTEVKCNDSPSVSSVVYLTVCAVETCMFVVFWFPAYRVHVHVCLQSMVDSNWRDAKHGAASQWSCASLAFCWRHACNLLEGEVQHWSPCVLHVSFPFFNFLMWHYSSALFLCKRMFFVALRFFAPFSLKGP